MGIGRILVVLSLLVSGETAHCRLSTIMNPRKQGNVPLTFSLFLYILRERGSRFHEIIFIVRGVYRKPENSSLRFVSGVLIRSQCQKRRFF